MKMNRHDFDELREKAVQIATKVHSGQVDKGGKDYLQHPLRVEKMCCELEDKIVALLHDTIEDGDITAEYLRITGFPQYIVDAVVSVSRKKGEEYFDFINRCKANSIGRRVKICDLKDNMDITRLVEFTDEDVARLKKYHRAYKMLTEE
jgi:(p)ppGpp synthase/HD superfamily hydrolase